MRVLSLLAIAIAVFVPLAASEGGQQAAPPAPAVKVGAQAPGFTLNYLARTADGKYEEKSISLADFKGRAVILAFFPAAFSPG